MYKDIVGARYHKNKLYVYLYPKVKVLDKAKGWCFWKTDTYKYERLFIKLKMYCENE